MTTNNTSIAHFSEQLEDSHVALCAMQQEHVEGLFQAGKHADVWQWTTEPYCISLDNTAEWVAKCIQSRQQGTLWPYVIINKNNNEIVGASCYLNIALAHKAIEIGYTFLSPKVQKTTVNRRCKRLLLEYAFEQVKVNRVAFQTHEKNVKSRTAIEGLGAVFEGINRNNRVQHDGSIRSTAVYSILKEEWAQRKSELTAKIALYE